MEMIFVNMQIRVNYHMKNCTKTGLEEDAKLNLEKAYSNPDSSKVDWQGR